MRTCSGFRFKVPNDSRRIVLYVPSAGSREDIRSADGAMPEYKSSLSLQEGAFGEWSQDNSVQNVDMQRGKD